MEWVIGVTVGVCVFIGSLLAQRHGEQQQALWMQLPPTERVAYESSEDADWLRGAGDADTAALYLAASLEQCRAATDAFCTATIEDALGRHYRDLADPQKALAHYGEARAAAVLGRFRALEGRAVEGIASAHGDLGDGERALDLHGQALRIAEEAGDVRGQALAWGGKGAAYRDLGKRREALDAFGRSVELCNAYEQIRSPRRILFRASTTTTAVALANLGAAHRDAGDLDASLRYYGWAFPIFHELGQRRAEAVTLLNVGAVHRDRGDARQALEHYERALPLLHALRHRAGEAQAAAGLARLLAERAPSRAIFHGKQAVATYEVMRGEIRGLDPALQDVYVQSIAGAYRRLAGLLASRARLPEAQEILALLKRREFFEYIRRDEAEAKGGEVPWTPAEEALRARYGELSAQLDETQRELVRLRRKRFLASHRRDLAVELPFGPRLTSSDEARLAVLEAKEDRALQSFREFFAGIEAAVGGGAHDTPERLAASAELSRALALLGPGHVGVYTLVGEESVQMLLVTPATQRAYTSPLGARELASAVLALREALEDPRQDARPAARRVYDGIVAPLAADLAGSGAGTIIWSLDGVLRYLPMGALHDGDRWLVERYRNVVFPGGDLDALTTAPHRPWTAVGLGVTKGHEGFAPLPGVRDELAAVIHGAHGGGGVLAGEELLDEAFTLGSLVAALEQRHQVVHVASHFRFRPGDESQSFLLLGDGSHLTVGGVRALPALFLGIDQVTLSACESAVQGGDGAEIDGLAVLTQKKGAAAVLASLWPVADVVTPAYMRAYYTHREAGMTRAAALQEVQLSMIRGTLRPADSAPGAGGWEHPFFWAPFVLLGNGL
jgi:CHAT domain-containing protein/tetratricopeptide (TPR) repeat protein